MLHWTGLKNNDSHCECNERQKRRKMHIPDSLSTVVLVLVGGRAVEVWILVACDAAASIVCSRLHLHPCVVHDPLNRPEETMEPRLGPGRYQTRGNVAHQAHPTPLAQGKSYKHGAGMGAFLRTCGSTARMRSTSICHRL